MSDYRYLETSGLRATEVAATLRALESYTPPAAGTTVLMEPFANFTFAPWTTGGGPTIVAGRHGTAAEMAFGAQTATFTIPTADDTNTVGFAFKTSHINPQHDVMRLLRSGAIETRVLLTATGALSFTRGSSIGIGSSGNVITATGTWYYVEVQVFSHDTAGTITARVNGTPVATLTGLDTRDVGTPNQVWLGDGGVGTTGTYDDLYVMTGAGAPFKGDITIP